MTTTTNRPVPLPSAAALESFPKALWAEGWTILEPGTELSAEFLETHPNGWPLDDIRAVALAERDWICIPPAEPERSTKRLGMTRYSWLILVLTLLSWTAIGGIAMRAHEIGPWS